MQGFGVSKAENVLSSSLPCRQVTNFKAYSTYFFQLTI